MYSGWDYLFLFVLFSGEGLWYVCVLKVIKGSEEYERVRKEVVCGCRWDFSVIGWYGVFNEINSKIGNVFFDCEL